MLIVQVRRLPRAACDDGDNDGDGDTDCDDTDYANDTECVPERKTVCDDELDNDQDGLIDCEDDDCDGEISIAANTSHFLIGSKSLVMMD